MFPIKRGKTQPRLSLTKPPRLLIHRAKEIQKELEHLKPLHEELDNITLALRELKDVESYGVVIKDKFADRNTVWKSSGIRRFELVFNNDDRVTPPSSTSKNGSELEVIERMAEMLKTIEERLSVKKKRRRHLSPEHKAKLSAAWTRRREREQQQQPDYQAQHQQQQA